MLLRNTKPLFSFDPFEVIKSKELLSFHNFLSNFDCISSVLLFIKKKIFLLATLDVYEMLVPQKMLRYFVAGLIIYSHVERKESCLLKINESIIIDFCLLSKRSYHCISHQGKDMLYFIKI